MPPKKHKPSDQWTPPVGTPAAAGGPPPPPGAAAAAGPPSPPVAAPHPYGLPPELMQYEVMEFAGHANAEALLAYRRTEAIVNQALARLHLGEWGEIMWPNMDPDEARSMQAEGRRLLGTLMTPAQLRARIATQIQNMGVNMDPVLGLLDAYDAAYERLLGLWERQMSRFQRHIDAAEQLRHPFGRGIVTSTKHPWQEFVKTNYHKVAGTPPERMKKMAKLWKSRRGGAPVGITGVEPVTASTKEGSVAQLAKIAATTEKGEKVLDAGIDAVAAASRFKEITALKALTGVAPDVGLVTEVVPPTVSLADRSLHAAYLGTTPYSQKFRHYPDPFLQERQDRWTARTYLRNHPPLPARIPGTEDSMLSQAMYPGNTAKNFGHWLFDAPGKRPPGTKPGFRFFDSVPPPSPWDMTRPSNAVLEAEAAAEIAARASKKKSGLRVRRRSGMDREIANITQPQPQPQPARPPVRTRVPRGARDVMPAYRGP